MKAITDFKLNIDISPNLSHPLVGVFIDPNVEVDEIHIQCIFEAIQYANRLLHGE